ncbi:MAG: S8 family serine peptidase, partial [Bacillota bacterium]
MSNNNIPKMMPFLIQCTERVGPPQRSQLESLLGAILSQYVPENSFLTRLSEDQAEAVRQLPFIKSVLPVSAEEKLEKELTNTLTRAEGLRQTIRIMAMLFEGADTQVAVEFVKECGGRVSGFDGQWLEIEIDAALVVELAGNPEVQYIEEAKDYELLNDRAGEITRAPSLWVKSFTGKGQIIGIADTGLDTGVPETMHQDFKNRTVAIYSLGRSEDASDFHGHGTHVAGSAFGGGTASEGRYRGMAPDAKFVFQSVMDKDGGLAGIPGDLGMLLDQAYMAGARV